MGVALDGSRLMGVDGLGEGGLAMLVGVPGLGVGWVLARTGVPGLGRGGCWDVVI